MQSHALARRTLFKSYTSAACCAWQRASPEGRSDFSFGKDELALIAGSSRTSPVEASIFAPLISMRKAQRVSKK